MNNISLILIIIAYLGILFFIALFAEKNSNKRWVNSPLVYTLSLAVYCTAWTYYGSIGIAAKSGINFLPIYLGPVIAFPLWIMVMKKIIRISKQHKISSIADFISLRYGNNRFLGALITIVCLIGTVPYISLQLKAISESYEIMTLGSEINTSHVLNDSTFYIALLLAIFATFFGTQTSDASEKHRGIVTAVAFESILKLVFFIVIGVYVTFYLFNGTEDIYERVQKVQDVNSLTTFNGLEDGFNWFFMIMLSFLAIFLLPRQFQMSVVENSREKHLKQAIWLFPLYLLLFNVFVLFIAWGGNITFGNTTNAEYYTLLLPLQNGNWVLALMVFLGGFSAVISMVVVSTLALSTMISNNLVIPYGFLDKFTEDRPDKNSLYIKTIRRISIFLIIIAAYLFYTYFSFEMSLFSIGLISFVIIAQLAPAFFIGLFWNRGSSNASIIGIFVGLAITLYTLVLPMATESITGSSSFTDEGLFGIENLKPFALFGIDFLSAPAHAFFWSLTANTLCYLIFSLVSKGNYRERNYAEMFVDSNNITNLQDNALVWKGEAYVADIKKVLVKFLGPERTERALDIFFRKYNLPPDSQMADARLISFSERLLTGSIGGASSKILISSVVKEDEISLIEVLKILEESKENISKNKYLKEQSDEFKNLTKLLKKANEDLIVKDKQKDDFLDTVAHELKTPITGIRAATELLLDEEDDMPQETKSQFLNNILNDSDRLSRLINHILDFEKLATGRIKLNLQPNYIKLSIEKVIANLNQILVNNQIEVVVKNKAPVLLKYDEDRIIQVITNLMSNAIKFCDQKKGKIILEYYVENSMLNVLITDNGKGIPIQDIDFIFNKFYQSINQNTIKPVGSGLGLAICQKIVENHQGQIWAKNTNKSGATFGFQLPFH